MWWAIYSWLGAGAISGTTVISLPMSQPGVSRVGIARHWDGRGDEFGSGNLSEFLSGTAGSSD